jgi:hypothetical protein
MLRGGDEGTGSAIRSFSFSVAFFGLFGRVSEAPGMVNSNAVSAVLFFVSGATDPGPRLLLALPVVDWICNSSGRGYFLGLPRGRLIGVPFSSNRTGFFGFALGSLVGTLYTTVSIEE